PTWNERMNVVRFAAAGNVAVTAPVVPVAELATGTALPPGVPLPSSDSKTAVCCVTSPMGCSRQNRRPVAVNLALRDVSFDHRRRDPGRGCGAIDRAGVSIVGGNQGRNICRVVGEAPKAIRRVSRERAGIGRLPHALRGSYRSNKSLL